MDNPEAIFLLFFLWRGFAGTTQLFQTRVPAPSAPPPPTLAFYRVLITRSVWLQCFYILGKRISVCHLWLIIRLSHNWTKLLYFKVKTRLFWLSKERSFVEACACACAKRKLKWKHEKHPILNSQEINIWKSISAHSLTSSFQSATDRICDL